MHEMGPWGYKHYFWGIKFTRKMPEGPDSMYSSIFMLENICYHNFTWTYSFPMHPFSTPWKHQKTLPYLILYFQREEKGCIGNEWVKKNFMLLEKTLLHYLASVATYIEKFWKMGEKNNNKKWYSAKEAASIIM